jgi:hypothetical protein
MRDHGALDLLAAAGDDPDGSQLRQCSSATLPMNSLTLLSTLLVAASLGFVVTRADAVIDWNQAALDAVRARNIPPPRVARDLAILHLAIHDAVNSIARTHESYAFTGKVPAAASRQAAAATAGYHALTALFPHPEDQAMFATLYADQLSMIPDLPPKRMGMEAGMGAAAAILELRAHDGSDQAGEFAGGTEPGQWRPTLSFGGVVRPALLPLWGWVTPFVLAAPDQFRPPAPPALQSAQYAEELEQVKWWGRDQGSLRNADQTEIALFWGYGPGTATPPGPLERTGAVRRHGAAIDTRTERAALCVAEHGPD